MMMNLSVLAIQSPACFLSSTPFPPRKLMILQRQINISSCKNTHHRHNSTHSDTNTITPRRSADYKPSMWDFDFVQSLKTEYKGPVYEKQSNMLKEAVRHIFDDKDNKTITSQLELIDTVERLGVGYLFKSEIKKALDNIYKTINELKFVFDKEDLHSISLYFRLLRQHGYEVSQDVFIGFMKADETGNLKSTENNIKGILSLYEACHLALEGETILDEAKIITFKYLNKAINEDNDLSLEVAKRVKHSLELPLHWRMQRLEARWYIDNICATENDINQELLKLAKLDYNMVQAIYQEDLREMSSWWMDLGLGSELSFARDRLMENFMWTTGIIYEPQFNYYRRGLTKVNSLLTIIDDVYDVYGTVEELEIFTAIVERWDINAMDQLPYYMKRCFLALYNTTNEIAYDILKEKKWDIIKYLKKAWGDLCRSYLVEAKWYQKKYTPTLEEYLNNAWISITGPLMLVHTYFLVKQEITKKELECLESYSGLIHWASMILRLSNDLGTSTAELERGDVPKSIQCYMHETGVSEDIAREHIRNLIGEIWKKMNKDRVAQNSPFSEAFIGAAVNLDRMGQCIYQYGDGHGVGNLETVDRISLLLIEPIVL